MGNGTVLRQSAFKVIPHVVGHGDEPLYHASFGGGPRRCTAGTINTCWETGLTWTLFLARSAFSVILLVPARRRKIYAAGDALARGIFPLPEDGVDAVLSDPLSPDFASLKWGITAT